MKPKLGKLARITLMRRNTQGTVPLIKAGAALALRHLDPSRQEVITQRRSRAISIGTPT